jgi:hypothetical protein
MMLAQDLQRGHLIMINLRLQALPRSLDTDRTYCCRLDTSSRDIRSDVVLREVFLIIKMISNTQQS